MAEQTGGHEGQIFDTGDEPRQGGHRLRSLQGEQAVTVHRHKGNALRQPRAHMGDVAMLGRAVDDHVEIVDPARDHQIVDDPAGRVEQQRIAHAVDAEALDVAGQQRLQRARHIVARQGKLPHMADVEQAGMVARPLMFGEDTVILDRHRIACERHHPRAARAVPRIERQWIGDMVVVAHRHFPCQRRRTAGLAAFRSIAPSVTGT